MHGLNRRPIYIMLGLLTAGTLMNCNCEEEEFLPSVTYDPFPYVSMVGEAPGTDLVFGDVSVNSEKTLSIRVQSDGRAPVNVIAANLVSTSQDGTWRVEVGEELDPAVGLTPGATSTIAVTFRPCPEAWNGDVLKEDFDFNECAGEGQAADLNVTDNTRNGSASFGLSGRPVQPPVAQLFCPTNDSVSGRGEDCGVDDPASLHECNGITFGPVSSNDEPCALTMEVRNLWRENKPVGDLEIQAIEVLVQELNGGDAGPIFEGEEVGFTIQDMNGNPLTPDPANPFRVQITPGTMEGSNRFKFVFSGARTGVWRGRTMNMTGLRLYTNDPDQRLISVQMTGQGSAPQLQCSPGRLAFGSVPQGTTETASVSCRNGGDAELVISNIGVESNNPEFALTTDQGTLQNITLGAFEPFEIYVAYTPEDTGVDSELLIATSNDPLTPRLETPMTGGAVPEIEIQPNDTLSFPIPVNEEPPYPPQTQPLTISNVGEGALTVSRLLLTGPGGQMDHESVDDFNIPECGGANPCNINLMLCAPGTDDCTIANFSKTLDIVYDNDDISTIDLVELHISSDDPANPEHIVVLEAEDEPCLFPTVTIRVTSPQPNRVGMPVMVDASDSNAGPIDATLTGCDWFWLFTPSSPPPPFNTQGLLTNSFVPDDSGMYVLGAHCTNSCGSTSQSPGRETILVTD